MKNKVRKIYKSFDTKPKIYEAKQADKDDLTELKQLKEKIRKKACGANKRSVNFCQLYKCI